MKKEKKGRKKTSIYQDFKMIKILMQVVVVLYHYERSWLTEIVEFHQCTCQLAYRDRRVSLMHLLAGLQRSQSFINALVSWLTEIVEFH